ncbi:MAG: TRAP transporter small permease [Desulfuromonadales bacterium]|nr:TRAP transporter small permease [Desulfuromonadales bacterium]
MKKTAHRFETIITLLSKGMSLLLLVIMVLVTWEVVSRYVFNNPTSWVWPVNKQLFGFYVLLAGTFTLIKGGHIRIEILHDRFPVRFKRMVSWLSCFLAVSFTGALVWQGWKMGWESYQVRELANGVFKIQLYPLKLFLPVAALVMLIAAVIFFVIRHENRDES